MIYYIKGRDNLVINKEITTIYTEHDIVLTYSIAFTMNIFVDMNTFSFAIGV